MEHGKIIAITGAPGSGKTTLLKNLAHLYRIEAVFEDDNLPDYIQDNIKTNHNGLQTILYFRNILVKKYIEAQKLKTDGITVVLDTFWLSNLFYVDTLLHDEHDRQLTKELIEGTELFVPMPDIIIQLDADDRTIAERIAVRGRAFESSFAEQAIRINRDHRAYFRQATSSSIVLPLYSESLDAEKVGSLLGLAKR